MKRIHSCRMGTAHSLPYGVPWIDTPSRERPHQTETPWSEIPPDRDPQTETPWTEIPPDRDSPDRDPPGQRLPDRDPPDRDPLDGAPLSRDL